MKTIKFLPNNNILLNNKTYNIYEVYDSPYGELFDELNILIDKIQ